MEIKFSFNLKFVNKKYIIITNKKIAEAIA
jgi:hypothetical protein